MKKLLTSTFLFFFFHLLVVAQESGVPDISIKFEKDTYQFIEPWVFDVVFINNNNKEEVEVPAYSFISGGGTTRSVDIRLEIKNRTYPTWTDMKLLTVVYNDSKTCYSLIPGQKQERQFKLRPALRMLDSGMNEFRVSHQYFCNGGITEIHSLPVIMTVKPYKGVDSLAFEYLLGLSHPEFILFPVISVNSDTSNVKHALYILEKFSESSLAQYANACLCFWALRKAGYNIRYGDFNMVLEQVRQAKKYAASVMKGKDISLQKRVKRNMKESYLILIAANNYEDLPNELYIEFQDDF